MSDDTESLDLILSSMFKDDIYARAVLPHLKIEYLETDEDKEIYKIFIKFFEKYNSLPTEKAMLIELSKKSLNQAIYDGCAERIKELFFIEVDENYEFLKDEAEKYCQDRALYNALTLAIASASGEQGLIEQNLVSKSGIPDLLRDALGVSFDTHVGLSIKEDYEERFKTYNDDTQRIPFDIDFLNNITDFGNGKIGLPKKTLTAFMGASGCGKTLLMNHCAAFNYLSGYNVVYFTMEMDEIGIGKRIDANILKCSTKEVINMDSELYKRRCKAIAEKTPGDIIVKQFPTGAAHTGHFRHFLNEIKTKRNFVPDIIYVDYLGICSSSRIRGGNVNSYAYQKSISEELRALAIEYDVPVVTAVQPNRSGQDSVDLTMTDVSDSMGVVFTFDLFVGLMANEEMLKEGKIFLKSLKNRDNVKNAKSMVGVDFSKMRVYNIDDYEQPAPDPEPKKRDIVKLSDFEDSGNKNTGSFDFNFD